jgi:hypothetical protein
VGREAIFQQESPEDHQEEDEVQNLDSEEEDVYSG